MKSQGIPHWLVEEIVGVSRGRLYHWRKEGLLRGYKATPGTRGGYSFNDLVAIRVIKALRDQGVSLREIKEIDRRLGVEYPDVENPITTRTVMAYGKKAVMVNKQRPFEALSGQLLLFDTRQMAAEMRKECKNKCSPAERKRGKVQYNFSKNDSQKPIALADRNIPYRSS